MLGETVVSSFEYLGELDGPEVSPVDSDWAAALGSINR